MPATTYRLLPAFERVDDPIELDSAEHAALMEAKAGLVATIGVEEKFEILVENYVEFEQEFLHRALRHLTFTERHHSSFQQERVTVTRRLANLLSAARLYLDQLHHDLGRLVGQHHSVCAAVRQKAKAEYDGRLGYRLMETLRNAVQHRSLAGLSVAHYYGTDTTAVSKDDDLLEAAQKRQLLVHLNPVLSLDSLEEMGLKASVRHEIRALGVEKIDLMPYTREYVDGLTKIHSAFREHLKEERSNWAEAITMRISSAKERWPQMKSMALLLEAIDSAGSRNSSEYFAATLVEYLQFLETKNNPRSLARAYVTSKSADL